MKKHSHGFTLIELTVVIVILGVLAATAIPRYLNLQRDARVAAVHGAAAALKDAAQLAYSAAVIDGVETIERSAPLYFGEPNRNPYASTNLGPLELKYGYPEAHAEDGGLGITDLVDLGALSAEQGDWDVCYVYDESDECYPDGRGGNSQVKVGIDILDNSLTSKTECYARYIEPEGFQNEESETYRVVIETAGC